MYPFTLGSTMLDTPITAYATSKEVLKGDVKPVLVTAGAHAEEAAGVWTALRLAEVPRFDGDLLVVPCRDPLGWDGVRETLRRTVDATQVRIGSHDEAVRVFRRYGELLHAEGGFVIAKVGELAFCSLDEGHRGNEDTGEFVQRYLRDRPEVAGLLRGVRLLVPGSPSLAEGRDVYGWGGGPTVYVDHDGRVGNFNRFFSIAEPPHEVGLLRDLAGRVEPEFTFDLHENFGDRFGMYVNPRAFDEGRRVYTAMIDGVRSHGHEVMPLADLLPYLDIPMDGLIELYPGVYGSNRRRRMPPDAFGIYVGQLGSACFTTEMGLDNPLSHRTAVTEIALRTGMGAVRSLLRSGAERGPGA